MPEQGGHGTALLQSVPRGGACRSFLLRTRYCNWCLTEICRGLSIPYICKNTVIRSECFEGCDKKRKRTLQIFLPDKHEERSRGLLSFTTREGDNVKIKYSLVRDEQVASGNFQVLKRLSQAHLTHMKPFCSVPVRYLLN